MRNAPQPVFEGKKRSAWPPSRRTTVQLVAGLAILAVPTWALATSGAPVKAAVAQTAPVAPTHGGAAPAPAPAGMPENSPGQPAAPAAPVAPPAPAAAPAAPISSAASPLERAYAAAVALQGAVVVHDWAAAARQLQELRGVRLPTPTTRAARARVAAVAPLVEQIDANIKAHNVRTANDQAYRLAATLLAELDTQAPAGGGGGGLVPPATPPHPMVALDHMRQASEAAAAAQLSLLAKDPKTAKTHLDRVRDELHEASRTTTSPALRVAIANLDKSRWRVVASLDNLPRAYRNGALLSRGLMRTMHLAGRRAARLPGVAPVAPGIAPGTTPGGGGGGRPGPTLQDVPTPTHANTPHRRPTKQVALDEVPYDKRDVR